ncbi:MAG: GatB/YqeY domain-containing protein [Sandaracinaceae bacterium]
MSLADRILEDLKTALRAKDETTKRTLRMLKSDLGRLEVELGRDLTEDDELKVLAGAVKSRRDSIAAYEEAERNDLADAERDEIAVLERYLPAQLDEAAARDAIAKLAAELGITQKKQMGQLMKAVMEKLRGQVDGKVASRIAGELLS